MEHKQTPEEIDTIASKLFRKIKGSVAAEIYFAQVAIDQFNWILDLDSTAPRGVSAPCDYELEDDNVEITLEPRKPETAVVRKRVCTNILGKNKVCMRKECTFAHNIEEWSPETCTYKNKCKSKDKCERLHGKDDTKELLAKKLGIVFMTQKKYLKTKMHIQNAVSNKPK